MPHELQSKCFVALYTKEKLARSGAVITRTGAYNMDLMGSNRYAGGISVFIRGQRSLTFLACEDIADRCKL